MISKNTRISLAMKLQPSSNVFPLRVIIGNTRYECDARVTQRTRLADVDRFDIEIVGEVRMTMIERLRKKRGKRGRRSLRNNER